jgi:hypothetical protein
MNVDRETCRASLHQVVTWVQLVVLLGAPVLARAQGLPDKPKTLLAEIALYAIGLGASITTIAGVIGFAKMTAGRAIWADLAPVLWGGSGIAVMGALAAYIAG